MNRLVEQIRRMDRRSYPAYKQLKGRHGTPPLELYIDHVQGDPFAAPSKIRIRLYVEWPDERFGSEIRRTALEDYLHRRIARWLHTRRDRRSGSGKSGGIFVTTPGQEILKRSCVVVEPGYVEIRLAAGLPAAGRRILAHEAIRLLTEDLPALARETVSPSHADGEDLAKHIRIAEDSKWLRTELQNRDLVAFIPDNAVLPRKSGIDPRPLDRGVKRFKTPHSFRTSFTMPSGASITGMGIPDGVTLIVGGGYHGKSTVLSAIERGVYDHIPGDGREFCVSEPSAMRIRAEEGRRVASVDISPFIRDLPDGRSTREFSTDDASGSTSQAAGLVEAVEVGCRLLLVDEDTAATNFMIRDRRMQLLVNAKHEPIIPFVDRVRELHRSLGISTILVLGGSGDYLDVADYIISMESYEPHDICQKAREVAEMIPTGREQELPGPLVPPPYRIPDPLSIDPSRGRKPVAIKTRRRDTISFGREEIDLGSLSGPTELAQVRAIGDAINRLGEKYLDGKRSLVDALELLETEMETNGLDILRPFGSVHGEYAWPRIVDIAAALNRLRTLRILFSEAR